MYDQVRFAAFTHIIDNGTGTATISVMSNNKPFRHTTVIAALLSASGLVLPSLAMAAENKVLEPSSPWKVDYAENECRLLRSFGNDNDAVTMRIARGSGLDSFDMVIAGLSIPKLPNRIDVTLELNPQGVTQTVAAYSLAVPASPERFIRWFDAKPDLLPAVTNKQVVRVRHADKVDIAMRWSDGAAALKALEACHFDLLKSWGVDVAAIKAAKVQALPIESPGRWATSSDYPSAAQQANQQGTVVFQVEVTADGSVANCVIVQSSLVPELDKTSCSLVRRRAKFTPALDANNQPITGYYVNRIRWEIP